MIFDLFSMLSLSMNSLRCRLSLAKSDNAVSASSLYFVDNTCVRERESSKTTVATAAAAAGRDVSSSSGVRERERHRERMNERGGEAAAAAE